MSITGTYGMGGRWDSCPFLHSASFNLSRDLREVLILACCQSPVPSRSFLKEDFGRTRRNPAIRIVAWRFAECKNFFVPKETCLCWFRTYNRLDGLAQRNFGLLLNALLKLSRVWIQSVLSKEHSNDWKTKSGASSISRSGMLEGTLCLEIMSLKLSLQMKNHGACF
jgi:hypothetical protein